MVNHGSLTETTDDNLPIDFFFWLDIVDVPVK